MDKSNEKIKECGVLMPFFSLPSKYGIGTFGKWAYKFVDLLSECGYRYWQVLPMVETGYGDSPYSTVSDGSLNPYFIDYEILRDKKLFTFREVYRYVYKNEKIDYGRLYNEKYQRLRLAFSRFDVKDKEFQKFLKKGEFDDYALYKSLKNKFNSPWFEWEDCYKFRDEKALKRFKNENLNEYLFWQWVEFECSNQYFELKKYANKKKVKIIGDFPLYVSYDSVDVWVNRQDFMLDENCKPKLVAGVPPDYFSATGQLWGNPVYDYETMRKNGFCFFKKRMEKARKYYDLIRLDHFRGYDRFWAVPYGESTAVNGSWLDGSGMELFNAIGTKNLFAEDLGIIDDRVRKLLSDSGLSGMKVLSFAFNGDAKNPYLPQNIGYDSITYTGTHDNETLYGYVDGLTVSQRSQLKKYLKDALDYVGVYRILTGKQSIVSAIIDLAFATNSKIAVVPMHDFLMKDNDYRINVPGKSFCWTPQFGEGEVFCDKTKKEMLTRAKRFNRFHKKG